MSAVPWDGVKGKETLLKLVGTLKGWAEVMGSSALGNAAASWKFVLFVMVSATG